MRGPPGRKNVRGYGGQSDSEKLLQVFLRVIELNHPKPEAPRLTVSTPMACGDFIRQWSEFAMDGTAVDEGISVRSCMFDNVLATVCRLSDVPTTCVPSITDTELLRCLRSVSWPPDCTPSRAGRKNGTAESKRKLIERSPRVSSTMGPINSSISECTKGRMRIHDKVVWDTSMRAHHMVVSDTRQSAHDIILCRTRGGPPS